MTQIEKSFTSRLCATLLMCIFGAFNQPAFCAKSTVTSLGIREKWALVIGINRFADPNIPSLRYAVNNANHLTNLFRESTAGRFAWDHVKVITGVAATKAAIEDAISNNWLVRKTLPNDLVVVYISTRIYPGAHGKDIELCTVDSSSSNPHETSVSFTDVFEELKHRSQCNHILCILDTAPAERTTSLDVYPSISQLSDATGVSVFAANKLDEPSKFDRQATTSYFEHYLNEGIKVGGGLVPLNLVSQYIIQNVHDEVSQMLEVDQTPELAIASSSPDFGDIPIGLEVKSSRGETASIGYKVDQLAYTRPDLLRHESHLQPQNTEDDNDSPNPNLDFSSYITTMKPLIQAKWQPPKGFENRTVVAVFTIQQNGTITDDEIIESSGDEAADRAARDALHAASPLPPLPLGAPKSVQIRYKFDWKIRRAM